MQPGISTAADESDVSGRGVGLDVVSRTIQGLGGKLSVNSKPGVGTIFQFAFRWHVSKKRNGGFR